MPESQRSRNDEAQIEWLAMWLAAPRKRQQSRHDLTGSNRLCLDHLQRVALRVGEISVAEEELCEGADARQRVVHLVCNACHELTDGRESVRLHESHAHLALGGHVAADEKNRGRFGFRQAARREGNDAMRVLRAPPDLATQ